MMPELSTDDVVEFTLGRLEDNDETQRMLDAALVAARHYAGWHVSPVRLGHEVVIDGPCSRILLLPTKKLIELTDITEDEIALDLDTLRWSSAADYVVRVRKRSCAFWSCDYASIVVTMDHGYTEAEAADWRQAILTMVSEMASVQMGASNVGLIRKRVDDVEYQWSDTVALAAAQTVTSVSYILDTYRLPRLEFL